MAEGDCQAFATSVARGGPLLRINGKPTDDRTSEINRAPVGLDHQRRGQSPVPRPLGTLFVSSGGAVKLSSPEALGGIGRHDVNNSDVKPKSPRARFKSEIKAVLLPFRSNRLLNYPVAPKVYFFRGGIFTSIF